MPLTSNAPWNEHGNTSGPAQREVGRAFVDRYDRLMAQEKASPRELPGLRVTVDRVMYHAQAQTPADRPHCFVYFITIHNDSEVPVTIKGRKWVVRGDDGEITALEGDGVVGQTPLILPGGTFSYNSFHLLRTKSAVAEGAYLGLDADGGSVVTRIPVFHMRVPDEEA